MLLIDWGLCWHATAPRGQVNSEGSVSSSASSSHADWIPLNFHHCCYRRGRAAAAEAGGRQRASEWWPGSGGSGSSETPASDCRRRRPAPRAGAPGEGAAGKRPHGAERLAGRCSCSGDFVGPAFAHNAQNSTGAFDGATAGPCAAQSQTSQPHAEAGGVVPPESAHTQRSAPELGEAPGRALQGRVRPRLSALPADTAAWVTQTLQQSNSECTSPAFVQGGSIKTECCNFAACKKGFVPPHVAQPAHKAPGLQYSFCESLLPSAEGFMSGSSRRSQHLCQ